MSKTKKTIAIHDLSGRGHCSLAAVLPILTVMGIEVCPLPTAVLSTQTDGYTDYSFVDLTPSWAPHLAHWQKEAMTFDCIYSGFLGSCQQLQLVGQIIDGFAKEDTLVLVDPVLGDNGSLYDTMTDEMVKGMRRLIGKAQVITPNYTEVLLLLDEPYQMHSQQKIEEFLRTLSQEGPALIIATSVPQADGMYTLIYQKSTDTCTAICNHLIDAHYPGTGDIFAAVVCALLLKGRTPQQAVASAGDFVREGIALSVQEHQPPREGIVLEKIITKLLEY